MNKRNFADILDECVSRLQDGEPVDSILESHPQDADRLRPLLRAAAHGRDLSKPKPSRAARAAGKERVIAAAETLQNNKDSMASGAIPAFSRYIRRFRERLTRLFVQKEKTDMKLAYRAALYVLLTVLVGGFFTVNASAESLPGDPLYTVKRSWEQARLSLSFSPKTEQELEEEFEAERLEEISSLINAQRSAQVEFEASVDSKDGDVWMVGGFAVHINQDTEVSGNPDIGSIVEVEGQTQEDGSIMAWEIQALSSQDDDMDDVDDDSDHDLDELSETVEIEDPQTPEPTESDMDDDDPDEMEETGEFEDTQTLEPTESDMDDDDGDDMDDDDMDDSEEKEASGTVENISDNSLLVDGVSYLIDEDTDMEDDLAAGDYVKLQYFENEEGDLVLLDVDVENDEMATPDTSDDDDQDDDDGYDESDDDEEDDDNSDDDDQDDDNSDDDET